MTSSPRLLLPALLGAALAVALAVVVALLGVVGGDRDDRVAASGATEGAGGDDAGTPAPQVSTDGEGVVRTDDGGVYAVWDREPDGTPVRWDPCGTIRWVLEAEGAPPEARRLVSRAMAIVSEAAGVPFEYVGTTDEVPSSERSLVADGPAGPDWAPVLVSWSTPDEVDLPMSDATLGLAVPVAVRDGDDQRVFVTGQLVLNAERTGSLLDGFQDRHATWGGVLVHEVAHLLGLAHVDAPTELLHPSPGFGPVELGPGDRAGLQELGSGPCLDVPPARDVEVTYAPAS